jgi:hypothetical protein
VATDSKALVPAGTDANKTKAIWASPGGKDMTPELTQALAFVGERYNLDPALSEVMILGSKVYVTLQGYQGIAQRHPLFEGMETWPLTDEERKQGRIAQDEHAWGCRVYRRGWRVPAVDWGAASERTVSALVKASGSIREMAKARAVRRTLKLAFGIDLPDPDEGFEARPPPPLVDTTTGEILQMAPPEPTTTAIKPDWARFWVYAKAWGMSKADVHEAMRLESVTQFDGSLLEALDICKSWLAQRRIMHAVPVEPPPPAPSAPYEPSDEEYAAIAPEEPDELGEFFAATEPSPIPDMPHWGAFFAAVQRDFGLKRTEALKELGFAGQPSGTFDWSNAYAQIREARGGGR